MHGSNNILWVCTLFYGFHVGFDIWMYTGFLRFPPWFLLPVCLVVDKLPVKRTVGEES